MRALTGVAVATALVLAGEAVRSEPAVPLIAERFLGDAEAPARSYRAIRRLRASNEKRRISGWLEALTEVDPEGEFRYHVTAEGGSTYIRNKVLRKVLATEQAVHERRDQRLAALTLDNYAFGDAVVDHDGFHQIRIVPRRRAEMLVNGVMVLDGNADLVRVEGRLSKNPSFWTRRVDVVRRYRRTNGVRVAVEMSSTAHVLVVGESTFTMCIDYETINGQPADIRTSCS